MIYKYTDMHKKTLRSDICNECTCYNSVRFLQFNDLRVFTRERHQMYLSLFYVEIEILDNENCIKIEYLVVKRASVERLTKKIMFLNLLTIFISRILYAIISRC